MPTVVIQKNKKYVKALCVILTILTFIYFFVPGKLLGLNPTYEGWLKNIIALIVFFSSTRNIRGIFSGRYAIFNIALLIYCIIQILSILLNAEQMSSMYATLITEDGDDIDIMGATSPKGVIFKSIMYLGTALFLENESNRGNSERIIRILLYAFAILVMIADFDAFFMVSKSDIVVGGSYIVGDKFTLCYMNLFLCTVYHLNHPSLHGQSIFVECSLIILLFVISVYSKCSTSIVTCTAYAVLVLLIPARRWTFFKSIRTLLITLFVLDILFFFTVPYLVEIDFFRFVIEDILHEDSTLTGRVQLYTNISSVFIDSPWFGFGQGNSFVMSMSYADAPDVQNGLLDIFLQTGMFGCASFILLLCTSFLQIGQKERYLFPIIIFVYTMIVASMVEIPFNSHFIFFIMLLVLKRRNIKLRLCVNSVRDIK